MMTVLRFGSGSAADLLHTSYGAIDDRDNAKGQGQDTEEERLRRSSAVL